MIGRVLLSASVTLSFSAPLSTILLPDMLNVHACRDSISKVEVSDDPHVEIGNHANKEQRDILHTVCEELGLPITTGPGYKIMSLTDFLY